MKINKIQKGEAIVEALIGLYLFSIVASGIAYAVSRIATAQKDSNYMNYIVKEIKEDVQTNGITNGCPGATTGTTTVTKTLALTGNLSVDYNKQCTITPVVVAKGSLSKTVNIPIITYSPKNTYSTNLSLGN